MRLESQINQAKFKA
jgi:hypothetical protein